MSILKLGIIGVGNFAVKRHIPEILRIKNKVELVSICRRDKKQLKKIGRLFKINSLYTNHLNMLKKEKLDLVLVSSPHNLHYRHAFDALNLNCHVIIEKPMTTTTAQAKKIINFSKIKNKKIISLYNPPFEPHLSKLKKIILDKKNFGKLEYANLTWLDYKSPFFGKASFIKDQISKIMPTNFRHNNKLSGGGILFDSGCHLIAEIIWILNKKPKSIFANFDNLKKELKLTINIEFKNSLFVSINIIGDSQYKSRRVESCYWGSKQTARLIGKPYQINLIDKNTNKNKLFKAFSLVKSPILEAIEHVEKNTKLQISAKQSQLVVSIIEYAYKSAKTGKKEKIKY